MQQFIERLKNRIETLKIAGSGCVGALCEKCKYDDMCLEGELSFKVTLDNVIEAIDQFAEECKLFGNSEQVKSGWIPCEEGLPEENIGVDVTVEENTGERYVQESWLQDGQWVIKKNPNNPKVIAWKHLPEPYNPKSE